MPLHEVCAVCLKFCLCCASGRFPFLVVWQESGRLLLACLRNNVFSTECIGLLFTALCVGDFPPFHRISFPTERPASGICPSTCAARLVFYSDPGPILLFPPRRSNPQTGFFFQDATFPQMDSVAIPVRSAAGPRFFLVGKVS